MSNEAGTSFGPPESVFDVEVTIASVQGDIILLKELIGLMLDAAQESLGEIQDAIAREDSRALELSAHKLKGAVTIFGARQVYDHCLSLEQIGRGGDLSQTERHSVQLVEEVGMLRKALMDFVGIR